MTAQANIDELVETLSKLTVLEMSKLKKALEDKWGVQAASGAVMAAAAAPAAGGAPAAAAESTEFEITLEKCADDKKVGVIKAVREVTGLGLKEAKDLVEGAPKVLKAKCSKEEADEILKKVAAGGGTAVRKGL